MEVKSMVETMTWIVLDGLALIWVLYILSGLAGGGILAQALQLISKALCG